MTNYRKKLIEVALPLDAINAESAREKSISYGHPSTFIWWSRKPLGASRAVIFASLVDDPSSRPDDFPDEKSQERERLRLFGIIEDLIKWENTQNYNIIKTAQEEIMRNTGPHPPTVVDPFAGGGTIPLSAQFLGLDTQASDLNPVAVLINLAIVELPSTFSGRHPVGPTETQKLSPTDWPRASGLAEDIRRYGKWMDLQAREIIGQNYPPVTIPSEEGGGRATVAAWIWAHTVTCTNPVCKATIPLISSYILSRKHRDKVWLEASSTDKSGFIRFKVRKGSHPPAGGTVTRNGAICLQCNRSMNLKEIRQVARAGGLGSQLLCTIVKSNRGFIHIQVDDEQIESSKVDTPKEAPTDRIASVHRTPNYGIDSYDKIFTTRQLQTLVTFTDLIDETREKILIDSGDEHYTDAIVTYLSLAISRLANFGSSQCSWNSTAGGIRQVSAQRRLSMRWEYAEANPFSSSSGNFLSQIKYIAEAVARVPAEGKSFVSHKDARAGFKVENSIMICTDPPYYNNIMYADLSDFFYVWLRRCLKGVYPDLFSTILVPKTQELIAEPARHDGNRLRAAEFFESGLHQSFEEILSAQDNDYPFTVFYAFKQSEDKEDGAGRVSTGWETMLQGLLNAGTTITGTWPMRTEKPGRLVEIGRAALASSIVLVCRRRSADAPLTTRRDFLAALRAELPDALRRLQQGNIAPVDLAQASIGPGMAVFSRYSKVIEADGTAMPVRAALAVINQVLDEVLASQEADFDGDTRWAVAWFEQHGLDEGSAGVAETLSKAKNTSISGLVQAGILEQRGNKCRLLNRGELDEDWTPGGDDRITVWEVVQHLIRTLEAEGEAAAGALLASVGGLGEPARELAYRLYSTCEKKGWSEEALAYNGLVVAWPELVKQAAQGAGDAVRLF